MSTLRLHSRWHSRFPLTAVLLSWEAERRERGPEHRVTLLEYRGVLLTDWTRQAAPARIPSIFSL